VILQSIFEYEADRVEVLSTVVNGLGNGSQDGQNMLKVSTRWANK